MPKPTPPSNSPPSLLDSRVLRLLSLLLAFAASTVAVVALATDTNLWDVVPAALMALLGLIGVVYSSKGKEAALAYLIVFGSQVIAAVGVVAYGSVRASSSFLFVASIAGAGTFVGARALKISVLTGVSALGLLALAERNGYLRTPTFEIGFITWFVQSCVLVVVAAMVFYARKRTLEAFDLRMNALEENRALAQERDRSLERFARILRTNPTVVITQSALTGEILDVNPAFERCYGYTREQVIGKTDLILWGQPAQREAYRERLLRSKRVDQFSVVGRRSDGSHFDAHVSSELSSDEEDMWVITSVTDMTQQNQAIERLRRSEERFAKAFNLSPLFMVITRLSDGTVLEVNRLDDDLPGITTENIRGQSTQAMGIWASEAERTRFVDLLKSEGQVKAFETQMRQPNGAPVDCRIWAVLIDIENEPCILACSMNVTEEKRRHDLLLDIAKGMTGPSAQAFFQALTQRMAHALGANMVLIGETSPEGQAQTLAVFEGGQSVENFQFPLTGSACAQALSLHEMAVFPSGLSTQGQCSLPLPLPYASMPFEAGVCQALRDADGQTIGILGALWKHPVEVTEEMRALMAIFASRATAELMRLRSERETETLNNSLERRVTQRTAELQKLNAELDSFAYSISHDLKSPLRAIDGFTQLLSERLEGRLDPEEQQLMARVLGATQRMSTLMADLLALARVSQNNMHREKIDLSQLAKNALSKSLRNNPRPKLRWQVEPGVFGEGDLALVSTLLEHLIDNALKFTRDQPEPLIEFGQVPLESGAEASGQCFFVRDNGVGFSMAHADKLFKPFQRLHMPSAGFGGTGIGLATAHRIVERHGGAISGAATPDQGAEFRFSLKQPAQAALSTA